MEGQSGPVKWWVVGGGLLAAVLTGGLYLASQVVTWVPEESRHLPAPRYLEHPPQYFPPSPAKQGTEASPQEVGRNSGGQCP
jgi:hypothetical protein